MLAALLGLGSGAAVGALMAHGRVCFNSGARRAVLDRDGAVLRIFAIAVAVQMLLLPVLIAFGLVEPDPPALFPAAQVIGGLAFGVGMAFAGGCVTGIMWKTGAGSIATAVAIAGFAAGELLARGPGAGTLRALDGAVARPTEQTLHGALGLPYAPLAAVLGALALVLLVRRSRAALGIGLALGALGALTWVTARLAGYGYGLGFTGTADNVRRSLEAGDAGVLSFQSFLAAGVIAGALAVTRGPLRLPDAARASRALGGGVLMGLGANAAHGCNIGLGLTGIPLLSLGSLLAVVSMAAGAVLTWRFVLGPLPALRGVERPEPVGW